MRRVKMAAKKKAIKEAKIVIAKRKETERQNLNRERC
jgi:hypothetical protein